MSKFSVAPEIHDIIANLVRRVAELERRLDGTKSDIETWSVEIENVKHAVKQTDDKAEMLIDDIVTLDERTRVAEDTPVDIESFSASQYDDGTTGIDVTFRGAPTVENVTSAMKRIIGGER